MDCPPARRTCSSPHRAWLGLGAIRFRCLQQGDGGQCRHGPHLVCGRSAAGASAGGQPHLPAALHGLGAGWVAVARHGYEGNPLRFADFFSGFRHKLTPLMLGGLLVLALFSLIGLICLGLLSMWGSLPC